ncbi:MAG: histidinol phosphate phosphatase domain-containing protein [Candidatus Omnitrophica bacterium]|nr:histidinol phosphate phosphatase domain-containing protein [Candidatus Omnitrophota bacterium]MBU1870263.1 histidinol phosphate phosphatase domain-containing protein [Candidatus Omnitrophota bacterium]
MYNLHTHSLLSDGVLIPSEIAVRYMAMGYKAIAITDHADYSNIDLVIKGVMDFCAHWPKDSKIKVLSGIELTHIPIDQFKPLADYARNLGIQIIIGHGQTPVEPVVEGTNRAALESDIDILAHPGFITDADVKLAKEKGIFLEITSRKGHSSTNAFVAEQGLKFGAKLILNHDSHGPLDIISPEDLRKVGKGAGLDKKAIDKIFAEVEELLKKKGAL